MVDCAIMLNYTTCRSMLVGTFMIDEDFIGSSDSIFDKVVSSGNDLGLDRNNFH